MAQRRFRISKLDSSGSIASDHRKIYCELRRGKIDGPLASRLSAMLIGQRTIIESGQTEERLAQLEERLVDLVNKGDSNVVKFRKTGSGFDI
jgi:hypothetical protein